MLRCEIREVEFKLRQIPAANNGDRDVRENVEPERPRDGWGRSNAVQRKPDGAGCFEEAEEPRRRRRGDSDRDQTLQEQAGAERRGNAECLESKPERKRVAVPVEHRPEHHLEHELRVTQHTQAIHKPGDDGVRLGGKLRRQRTHDRVDDARHRLGGKKQEQRAAEYQEQKKPDRLQVGCQRRAVDRLAAVDGRLKRSGQHQQDDDRAIEEAVHRERPERGRELHLWLGPGEHKRTRELAGAQRCHVVHHHADRGCLPERRQRKASVRRREQRLPPARAEWKNQRGERRARGPQEQIRTRQRSPDTREILILQHPPEERGADGNAKRATPAETHRLLRRG